MKRNPKILDSLLTFKTKEKVCTLSPLIMSPSEQLFSVSSDGSQPQLAGQDQKEGQTGTPVEVVTRRAAASPTLFQIGGPSVEGEEEREEGEMERDSKEVGGATVHAMYASLLVSRSSQHFNTESLKSWEDLAKMLTYRASTHNNPSCQVYT